jgi:6-phosphogluconolactonase
VTSRTLLATLVATLVACAAEEPAMTPEPLTVYVGTYTDGESEGIYRFTLDPLSGETTPPELAAPTSNPSFLALHPRGGFVYAVNETDDFRGERTGAVSAFAIEPGSGTLRPLNQQPSQGAHPCHLLIDEAGKNVLVANYTSGTLAVLPIRPDGSLGAPTDVQVHHGSGPNASRQEGPHAHGLAFDPAGRHVLAADLGADRVFAYGFDGAAGTLAPLEPSAMPEPGSGPRHVAFHPSGRFVYAINELLSTVSLFRYPAGEGEWRPEQTVSTLPDGFQGKSSTAELLLSPDGRFLYGSNRGHDSLAVFSVDSTTGRLSPMGHVPVGGRTPRHFTADPTGRWLLVANQGSDGVVVLRRDPDTGLASPVGEPLAVSKPVCLLPVPAAP